MDIKPLEYLLWQFVPWIGVYYVSECEWWSRHKIKRDKWGVTLQRWSVSVSPYSIVFSADSPGSSLRALRPCFELLWTNMLSDTARTWPSTLTVLDKTTWKKGREEKSQEEDTWVFVHDLDSTLRVTISGYSSKIPEQQFISAYRRW